MKWILETPRLLLREVHADDADGFFEMDSDPMVARYVGAPPAESREHCSKVIQSIQDQYVAYGIGRWSVISKESGEFLGWCGLKWMTGALVNDRNDFVDIGYRFSQRHWGKGYATESAKATLDYGFEQLGFTEICAHADIRNTASQQVLTKIGMQRGNEFEWSGISCVWFETSSINKTTAAL